MKTTTIKDNFSTPSCYDFRGLRHCQCSFTVLYNKKFLASTYSIPNLGGGGGPRPDTDKLEFRGTDLKVPGIPLLKKATPPPPPSHPPPRPIGLQQ
jgi:hypothetical protein